MGIQPLPSGTVRLLGAAQALTEPASVVKELVENGLDARASSISVEISANTLDSIHVKDNGHGVPPQDRRLVAKDNCTSKITSHDDVKLVGGRSLGFRGQALAGIAALSGSLTISTRVEGEQAAVKLAIDRQGDVFSSEKASLPVGTDVKVGDFMQGQPVRRQQALQRVQKSLRRIKQMLQAYAFARPHVRLSLRVVKPGNGTGNNHNWVFAPKPGSDVVDAAIKIVGTSCASQCTWSVLEDKGLMLHAFLPRPDADVGKISGIGAFVYVDARPLSCARGTPKQIVQTFRESLKRFDLKFEGVKEPFVYFNAICPGESYDVNVEPAKNDVLFEDPDVVVSLARRLFDDLYSPLRSEEAETQAEQSDEETLRSSVGGPTVEDTAGGIVSPARSSNLTQNDVVKMDRSKFLTSLSGSGLSGFFPLKMYDHVEDIKSPHKTTSVLHQDENDSNNSESRMSVSTTSPGVRAKMNAALYRASQQSKATVSESLHDACIFSPQADLGFTKICRHALPTPQSSPTRQIVAFHPSDKVSNTGLFQDSGMIGASLWSSPQNPTVSSSHSPNGDLVNETGTRRSSELTSGQARTFRPNMSGTGPEVPELATCASSQFLPAKAQRSQPRKLINQPFVLPLKTGQKRTARAEQAFGGAERSRKSQRSLACQRRMADSSYDDQTSSSSLQDSGHEQTRPHRNRDIREFVVPPSSNATVACHAVPGHTSIARKTAQRHRSSASPDDGNGPPASTGAQSSSSLVHRYSLASACEQAVGPASSRSAGRRKSARGRVATEAEEARDVAAAAAAAAAAAGSERQASHPPPPAKAQVPTRTRSRRLRRARSSRLLPLEHIPERHRTHALVLNLATGGIAADMVAVRYGNDRLRLPVPPWRQRAEEWHRSSRAVRAAGGDCEGVAASLEKLLIGFAVGMGEDVAVVVPDLGEILGRALASHVSAYGADEEDPEEGVEG